MNKGRIDMDFTGERFVPTVHGNIELEHVHRYLLASKLVEDKAVLDIASGEGYGTAMLARIANKVIGVDISKEAVLHARSKYQAENIEFVTGSCGAIPIQDDSVDVVVSFETIEHHDQHHQMMEEIKRVLRPGGVLIISSPDKREYSDCTGYNNPYHVKELYRREFKDLLSLFFRNIRIYGQRIVYGSAILAEDAGSEVESYDVSDESLVASPGVKRAIYLIAVASDNSLPSLSSGILEQNIGDSEPVQQLREVAAEREREVDGLHQIIMERDGSIAKLQQLCGDLEQNVAGVREALAQREEQLKDIQQIAALREGQIEALSRSITEMKSSTSWRLTGPLRFIIRKAVPRGWRNNILLGRALTRIGRYRCYWVLKRCPLFDRKWYLAHNSDVMQAGVDPLMHYIVSGWKEGRPPSQDFDGAYYIARYRDVEQLNEPPLFHYWRYGRFEGRYINAELESAEGCKDFAVALGVTEDRSSETSERDTRSLRPSEEGCVISVIIPTYNRIKLLPGIIEAWREVHACTGFSYEIIFSDDGSSDGTAAYLDTIDDLPLRVIHNAHGGASSARNAAIRAALGERLLMLGDDIFPDKEILNVHAHVGSRLGPKVAVLGVVEWHSDLPVNHLMRHITEVGNEQFSYNRLADGSFIDFRHFYTCNISINRRMLLGETTIFDERFNEYGFEDIELGYRLSVRGLKIYHIKSAKGAHYHPYNLTAFCRRQISSGKMAVVFSNIHPEIDRILDVATVVHCARKYGSPINDGSVWEHRLSMLTRRCDDYESLIAALPMDISVVMRECLSAVYARLFRAMYELGVLEKRGGLRDAVAVAMEKNFDDAWKDYWAKLKEDGGNELQLSPDEIYNLAEALIVGRPADLHFGEEQTALFDEFVCIKKLASIAHVRRDRQSYRHLVSRTLYYMVNNPRHLVYRAKRAVVAAGTKRPSLAPGTPATTPLKAAVVGLIVGPDGADPQPEVIAAFQSALGDRGRIYRKTDNERVVPLVGGREQGEPIPFEEADATIFFWPTSTCEVPARDHLLNAFMAVAENGLSIAVISHGLRSGLSVSVQSLRDNMLFSGDIAKAVFEGRLGDVPISGKVLRLLPAHGAAKTQILSELIGAPLEIDDDGFFRRGPADRALRIPYKSLYLPQYHKTKPVAFVFPIFLAVGGVERNTIEIMRRLNDQYDFIVITMERLRPEQGSLAAQAMEVAERVIEMSEIVRHSEYLRLLSRLKVSFQPDLIWVCNGSPWFCGHSTDIRKIFYDVPIIDQEAYDVDQGWITRYGDPGIQSFDHFIAINSKIQQRFLRDFSIKREKITLIYPAIDTHRITAFKQAQPDGMRFRSKYGIPESKAVFAFIGRLTDQKRPIEFLSLAKDRCAYEDECYVLVGDGELAGEVDRFIKTHHLDNVIRIPYIENILELDAISDGIVFTSAYEGLPVAMLEALAMGVPAFSTDVGDIAYVLKEYGGGVTVDHNCSHQQFHEAFVEWRVHLKNYKENLSRHESEILDRFSSERIAMQYAACWDRARAKYSNNRDVA